MSSRIWVNGAFDVLHVGHIRLLRHAASLGRLIVGINSDSSIRALKGPSRPINDAKDRAEMLMAVGCDSVIVFDEPTPMKIISLNWPIDVIVKGMDYKDREFPERLLDCKIEFFDSGFQSHSSDIIDRYVPNRCPICGADVDCRHTAEGSKR